MIKNLEQRLDFQKYNIKEKEKKKHSHKNYEIYMYEDCFKNRVPLFFRKVIVDYKNEN